jgi:hypothetical protein
VAIQCSETKALWALVTFYRLKFIYILDGGDNNLGITLTGDFKKAIDTHGTADTSDDTYIMSTDSSNNYAPDGEAAR